MDKILKRTRSQKDEYPRALAQAEYKDDCFPPTLDSLLGVHGARDQLLDLSDNIVWKRAREIFQGKPYAIFQTIEVNDIQQQQLGDCYYLSSVAALAEHAERVKRLFPSDDINTAGCYPIEVYIMGRKVTLLLDEYMPVLSTGDWCFAKPVGEELWVVLLEKAWARVNGSYGMIESGDPGEALHFLTGAPCERQNHSELLSRASPWMHILYMSIHPLEEYWKRLLSASDKRHIMTASGGGGRKSKAECEAAGILSNHAYSLLKAVELNYKGHVVRLLKLRNPWGSKEWNREWSDEWTGWDDELLSKLKHTKGKDGLFYMLYSDFLEYYSATTICLYNPHFIHSTVDIENDSYSAHAFEVTQSTHGHIGLVQLSERMVRTEFPNYRPACLFLVIARIIGSTVEFINWMGNTTHESHIEVQLQPGRYIALSGAEYRSPIPRRYGIHTYMSRAITFVKCRWEIEVLAQLGLKIAQQQKTKWDKTNANIWQFSDCELSHCLGIDYFGNPREDQRIEVTVRYTITGLRMIYPHENATVMEKSLAPNEECVVIFICTSPTSISKEKKRSGVLEPSQSAAPGPSAKIAPYLAEVNAVLDGKPIPSVESVPKPAQPSVETSRKLAQPSVETPRKPEAPRAESPRKPAGQEQPPNTKPDLPPRQQRNPRPEPMRNSQEVPMIQRGQEEEKKDQPSGSNKTRKDDKRFCKEGNELEFTYRLTPSGRSVCIICFAAFECRNGRWGCPSCAYEVCRTCRAPPPLQCPNSHEVRYTIELPSARTYCCVFCRHTDLTEKGLLSCVGCGFHLCFRCVPKLANRAAVATIAEMRAQTERKYVRCCERHHTLSFSYYMTVQKRFSCNLCKLGRPCEAGRWFCNECQYELCRGCRPPPPEVADHDATNDQKCPAGHILGFGTNIGVSSEFTCAKGKHQRQRVDGVFYCSVCDYIVCQDCMPVIYNSSWSKLDACGHPYIFCVGKDEHHVHFRCNICAKSDLRSNGSMRCGICDIDVCVSCLIKTSCLSRKPPSCKAGHTMECSWANSINTAKNFTCNDCRRTPPFSAGRWFCSRCNVASCSSCNPLLK